jgi:hypothetical protein
VFLYSMAVQEQFLGALSGQGIVDVVRDATSNPPWGAGVDPLDV